jgi:hypothetical protein
MTRKKLVAHEREGFKMQAFERCLYLKWLIVVKKRVQNMAYAMFSAEPLGGSDHCPSKR